MELLEQVAHNDCHAECIAEVDDWETIGTVAAVAEALADSFVMMVVVGIVAVLFRSCTSTRPYHASGRVRSFYEFDCKQKGVENENFVQSWSLCVCDGLHLYVVFLQNGSDSP